MPNNIQASSIPKTLIVNRSYTFGNHIFVYRGVDKKWGGIWSYQHMDGVLEVFNLEKNKLDGVLGSKFDLKKDIFSRMFSPAKSLLDFKNVALTPPQRSKIALHLLLFLDLHDGDVYYLNHLMKYLEKYKTAKNRKERQAFLKIYRNLNIKQHSDPVRKIAFSKWFEYFFKDSYLDVTVVGGNSRNASTLAYQSSDMIKLLKRLLKKRGFEPLKVNKQIYVKKISINNRDVIVRVRITYATLGEKASVYNVVNFVEGIAHGDVVAFIGHSNHDTKIYHLSETKEKSFRFSFKSEDDLLSRFHNIDGLKPQVVLFFSCASIPRYAKPFFDISSNLGRKNLVVLGTDRRSWFVNFPPRFIKLLDSVIKGKNIDKIIKEINSEPKNTKKKYSKILKLTN